ncbi:ABC transporter ATP-binding protein [Pseudosulfitobacter pseudonitzschiae]|uniref:ABC transporter ATP-binding protein n=1 Tax=Pseudosulfitobacter pseudonitzschiae TaxID=1402135 RepID=UPI001AF36040|nr:ABC transporter ATP-binding protein [Pseudosulfitobacter pseudonitzschiae]MBM1815056.1 ABC transporter ATP-binding protein [Pseudosulfitobacter pseudonitzschiae]MBM1832047.1 ABC transporter ATP-binding protein [Pseudosulfitobacter pseudonitzschiae]MBM1836915.1 ABC transporter ATP-binding protein [Pseudosulfitobacter pseudonitzschiae]MBM1841761.1 ABC transporter ATP-binding protein [Pseudosulfitobacter pseudonitzschiae]MBM1846629.1 ABC transporter ATP-binding protein [Pseudosulfitobacter pse
MTLLELDNIVVEFPTRRGPLEAVKGLSLELDEGQILGLVGESGAGKSITGAAITGLIEPPGLIRSGQVRLRGQRIDNLAPEKMRRIRGKEIGAIFQDPLTSLNPVYTVGEQLIDTMRLHLGLDHKAARKRAIDWLAEVGIPAPEARLDQYPHQFSGGMRQRVVIALALCAEPKLIIADEPTTALDVSVQAQILALLKRLCRENGTAVVLVTHDMGVIAETADRVAVMYAGRLVEIGDVAQVIQDPLHPYTKGLMNSIPQIGNRDARLTQIEGAMPGLRNPAPGCAFAPRCPQAMDACRTLRPVPVDAGSGQVACHLFGEAQ